MPRRPTIRASRHHDNRRLLLEPLEQRVVLTFAASVDYTVGKLPQGLDTGDFNGDSQLDVIVANSSGNVGLLLGNGDGTLNPAAFYPADIGARSVAVGDFDQDPLFGDDAVTANAGSLSLLTSGKAGTLDPPVNTDGIIRGATESPHSVAVGDLDLDGDLDIVETTTVTFFDPVFKVTSVTARLEVYRNNLDPIRHFASFSSPVDYFLYSGTAPDSVQIASINGNPSVVFVNPNLNTVSVMLGNGAGGLAAAVNFNVGASPQSVTAGNFNGDGLIDLAVANAGTSGVSILLGTGTAQLFQAAGSFAVGSGPTSIVNGDFNGDGHTDLATANLRGGDVSLLLGYGDGVFAAAQSLAAGLNPSWLTAADLNTDGLSDLVASSGTANTVSILLSQNDWAPLARPTASVSGPAAGRINQELNFTFGASESGLPAGTVYSYAIDWNSDGTTDETASGPAGTVVAHAYTAAGNHTASVMASDPSGGTSAPATYTTHILGATFASVSGPAAGLVNQDLNFTFGGSVSGLPAGTVYSYAIDWNSDGTTDETASGPAGTMVAHAYTAAGNYTVSVMASDPSGGTSAPATCTTHIVAATIGVQPDPGKASQLALVIGGSAGGESIVLSPGGGNSIAVSIDGYALGEYAAPGGAAVARAIVNAGGGDDVVTISGGLSIASQLSGDDGNDTLNAAGSSAPAMLLGGAGNDSLTGGSDRDLLIGGLGSDTLSGNGDDDILIGGSTNHDPNDAALLALMAEWDQAAVAYSTRISHLAGSGKGKGGGTGLNGPYLLNSTTVHDDGASDTLAGGAGTDWFLARLKGAAGKDVLTDKARTETATSI